MSKLTSVEFFANELIKQKIIKKDIYSTYHDFPTTFELILEQAKEMHKEEIEDAYSSGRFNYEDWDKGIKKTLIQSKDYYKQHYTNEQVELPQQLYTEEQVREAIEMAREHREYPFNEMYEYTDEEIIQSLKQHKQ